jgi:hypothetical protein
MELAKEKSLRKMVLETDCLAVVAKLKGTEMDRSIHGPLIEEMKFLLKCFTEVSIKHVRRSGNMISHNLAKESCENKCNRFWLVDPAEFIVDLLASEDARE